MSISPAAFNWLLRIGKEGTLLVDTWNGCIRNLRAALLIRYTHKSNGCAVRPCPICGYPAIENRDVLTHFVPKMEPGPCTWRADRSESR